MTIDIRKPVAMRVFLITKLVKIYRKAVKGESVDAIVDTGCKFYNYENIDDPDIVPLVYD